MAPCGTGRPPCSWASTVLRVSPQTWERSHLTAILKPRKVWCVFFFHGVFPWEQSRWARTRGSAEAAYRLTPSRLQPGAAAAISAVNLITNKGGVEAKLSSC